MKTLAVLAAAMLVLAFSASATTTGFLLCSSSLGDATDTIAVSNPGAGYSPGAVTIYCPGSGAISSLSTITAVLYMDATFAGGPLGSTVNSTGTEYASIPGGVTSDDITGSGLTTSTSYTDTSSLGTVGAFFTESVTGLTLTSATSSTAFTLTGAPAANGGTPVGGTVATTGTIGSLTDDVYVQYTYTTTSASPEPISMLLFGSGLLAVSLIGRKRLIRK